MKNILGLKLEKGKKVGLQIKLTLIFTLLLVGLSVLNFALNYTQSLSYLNEGLGEQLLSIARTSSLQIDPNLIEKYLQENLPDKERHLLQKQQRLLTSIKTKNSLDGIYIFIKRGIFAHALTEEKENNILKKREIDETLANAFQGKSVYTRQWGLQKSAYFPLKNKSGKVVAVLGIDAESEAIIKSIDKVKYHTILFLFFSLLMSILVSIIVATAITTPLKQLVFTTLKVAKGDLSHEVKIKNLWGLPYRDEIGELAISFSKMITSLKEKEEENRSLYNEIKTSNVELEKKIKEAIHHLEITNKQLMEEEDERKQELELAQRTQQTLLPNAFSHQGINIVATFIPAKGLGGDFYNFMSIDENHLGIVVGDVAGKGVSAGLLMAMTVGILHAESKKTLSPAEILHKANSIIFSHIGTDYQFFVSSFYAVLNVRDKILSFSKAGHERPLWFRKASQEVKVLDVEGVFLGIFADTEFEEKKVKLEVGDKIIFYTDGVYEAKNKENEIFGEERISFILQENPNFSAQQISDLLRQHLLYFVGDLAPADDIAFVVLEVEK